MVATPNLFLNPFLFLVRRPVAILVATYTHVIPAPVYTKIFKIVSYITIWLN